LGFGGLEEAVDVPQPAIRAAVAETAIAKCMVFTESSLSIFYEPAVRQAPASLDYCGGRTDQESCVSPGISEAVRRSSET
jgi:hypothetical protein